MHDVYTVLILLRLTYLVTLFGASSKRVLLIIRFLLFVEQYLLLNLKSFLQCVGVEIAVARGW